MTSKTSLFNMGIYKSTIRRYIWGSVLYAILLFMTTAMTILFSVDPETHWLARHGYEYSLILSDIYLYLPLIMSIAVSTVVALLVYRFVHSKKASVFVHSLPVSRTANYISTLASALTLMSVPVILNGFILILLSIFGYGALFDVSSCFIWIGINLLSILLMFSASSFSAFLTGNSFALVGLNILIHCFAIIFAAGFSTLASSFLYGYYESNILFNAATERNFVVYIMSLASDLNSNYAPPFDPAELIIMIVLSLALYLGAWLFYKKRRLETAEDVAAYKCLNPIYKYLLTFLAALGAFGISGYSLSENPILPITVVVIVSAVVYFASEMMLKKSLKIGKSYKGYLVFLAGFTALICVFAFTGFFGYETRVPNPDDIEAVAVYESHSFEEEPYVADPEITEYALEIHRELVKKENIYTFENSDPERNTYLYFNYKLKNGNTLTRCYLVREELLCEVLDTLYKSQEYKMENLVMFSDNIGKIYSIRIDNGEIINDENIAEFVACMQSDLLALDYTETRVGDGWSTDVWIEYIRADELESEDGGRGIYPIYQSINASFKNTVGWLREHGYLDVIFDIENTDLVILSAEQWKSTSEPESEIIAERGVSVAVAKAPHIDSFPDVNPISDRHTKAKIRDFVLNTPVRYVCGKDFSYYVFRVDVNGYLNPVAAFYEDGAGITELQNGK